MKRLFPVACLLLVLLSFKSFAINYYLSNNGNDASSGTSPAEPWQTISQLNAAALLPGDSIFFLSANIFRGQINVTSGGNESAPIYFGTYGGIDPAIISGSETVTSWSVYSGNIYQATFIQTPAHLFSNQQQMTIARFPNTGFMVHQEGLSDTAFVDSSLSQPDGYWNGATVRMRTSDRLYETNVVSDFSNFTVTLQSNSVSNIENGYGYYFDNLFSALDTTAEWYYDAVNQLIYFYSMDDPGLSAVEASVYDHGIEIQNGASHILINHLQFEKQRRSGINLVSNPSFISITSCKFMLQGERGIAAPNGAVDCLIQGNEFTWINGQGIGDNTFLRVNIQQNIFKRISLVPGYGLNEFNNGYAIVCGNSDSINVSNNLIDSTGSGGIFCDALNSVFKENILHHTLLTLNDLGAIYCYGAHASYSDFISNIILYCHGNNAGTPANEIKNAGIYLDASFSSCTINKNTIADAVNGLWIKDGSSENIISSNLIYNCSKSQLLMQEGNAMGTTAGNQAHGNIFYALSESQEIIFLSSPFEVFSPVLLDSNYYFNPYNFFSVRMDIAPGFAEFPKYYTLSQWQQATQTDNYSHATYFSWNRYNITDSLSGELIQNGMFTNNFDGWVNEQPDSITMLLDNSTPLDYGCLKLAMTVTDPSSYGNVYTTGFAADSGQFYRVSLNNYSIKNGNVAVKLKNSFGSYALIALQRFFPFGLQRNNFETVIAATGSCDPCRLYLQLYGSDSIIWTDNISLLPVSVSYIDPKKKSRLFVNELATEVSIDLGDSIFFDLDQNLVSQQLILPPYSSAVLIFDSSLISSGQELPAPSSIIGIFPNPAQAGSTLHLLFNNEPGINYQLELRNAEGKLLDKKQADRLNNMTNYMLPKNIHGGIYFLNVYSATKIFTAKIVVVE